MKYIPLILSMISASCGTEVKAEPEQEIIIQTLDQRIINNYDEIKV